MKKIACSIALLIAASVAVAEELFTFVNDGDGYGYSYIRINQDLDSFSFSSDWHMLGNVGKVGYVVYSADMSEIDCAAYMEANANNPEFGKNINGGVIDLGALKAGDRVGFYEVRQNGSTYTRSAFNEWKDQLWLAFGKGGSDTKDEWMTIEDIKAVSAGGSSPCDSVAVSNVVAWQRWPWNGLVDVDYEIGGDPGKLANLGVDVVFEELGGENRRWVATKFLDNANRIASVGRHRLTWDTKAQGVTNVVAAKVVAAVSLTELPEFVAYSTGMASAGGVLGIAGKRLDLVKTIAFCGSECPVDVTASASETMINLVVPMDSKTGKLVATLANGIEVEFPSIGVVEAVFCYAKSLPGDDVELKAGGSMTITATNVDKLKSVEINDVECQYSVTGNQIAVEIPETTSAKATLKLVSVNGEISYSISVIPKAVSETNERQTIIWYNTHNMKRGMDMNSIWLGKMRFALVAAVALGVWAATAATVLSASSSAEFRLDTREGQRDSDGSETLAYSSLWDGNSNSVVAIAQVCDTPHTTNGTLVSGLGGEGSWDWTAQYDGVYTLTHATVTGGATGKVETATFVVRGLGLPQMTIEVDGYDGAYDGKGHGISVTVTDPADASVGYALAEEGPYTNGPILFTNVTDSAVSVWYAAEARGYASATNFATVKIAKAVLDGEPGQGAVPEGGVSKFDVEAEYDGAGHTVDADAILAAFQGVVPGASVGYALSPDAEKWTGVPVALTNVCTTSVWYRATLDNYEDFVHEIRVTVVPRDIAKAHVEPIDRIPFGGVAVRPVPVVTDGAPSIITEDDYDVSYRDNDKPGTATLVLTGKNNYTGTKEVEFAIGTAELTAEIGWKYLQASGTYFAHLEVTCTNSLDAGVDAVRFLFADRTADDGSLLAALWNTPGRAANANTAEYDGATYRCVDLDASLIEAENVPATYGVRDVGAAQIPVGERTIEMYVQKRVVPETGNEDAARVGNFVGFLYWESSGEAKSVPVVARGSRSFSSLRAMKTLAAPVSAARLNAALAVGVMPGEDGEPYCRFSEFSADGDTIRGKVEVGADGQAGALGANARLVLLGGDSPGGELSGLCTVEVGPDGSFSVPAPKDARFFRLALEIGEVAE